MSLNKSALMSLNNLGLMRMKKNPTLREQCGAYGQGLILAILEVLANSVLTIYALEYILSVPHRHILSPIA